MNLRTILLAALGLSSVLASACKNAPPTPSMADVAPSGVTVAITSADAGGVASGMPTAPLREYFPQDGAGGYRRVLRANRTGYAEASLEKDGKEVAVLSISDAERLAYAKAKFESATEQVGGFPLLTTGKDLSTVLVRNRFEIRVLSRTLDASERKQVIAAFDLKRLGT